MYYFINVKHDAIYGPSLLRTTLHSSKCILFWRCPVIWGIFQYILNKLFTKWCPYRKVSSDRNYCKKRQGPLYLLTPLLYKNDTYFSWDIYLYIHVMVIFISALPPGVETRHHRHSSGDNEPSGSGSATRRSTNLSRSRSAQSLKHIQDSLGHDDKITILSQMFWIAVSMLESDYEYEFLLAIRLLDKVIC